MKQQAQRHERSPERGPLVTDLKRMSRGQLVTASLATAAIAIAGPRVARAQTTAKYALRIGTPGSDSQAGAWYAQDFGFFAKNGIDATIDTIRGSGAGTVGAVLGGTVDIGEADLVAISAAREHGISLIVLAPSGTYTTLSPTTVLVVAKNSTIATPKDLEGKTVAVLSLEGPARIATAAWIDKGGANLASVKFVELPPASMGSALERGTIDAATLLEPSLSAASSQVKLLAKCYDAIATRFTISAWFCNSTWQHENPLAAKAFIEAMHETNLWADQPQNHTQTGESLAKHTSINPDIIPKMARAFYLDKFDPKLAQPLIDAAVKYKQLNASFPAQQLLQPLS
jgi:NitT/TauT family transport system substrate-binding protein